MSSIEKAEYVGLAQAVRIVFPGKNVGVTDLRKAVEDGDLKSKKVDGKTKVKVEDVEEWGKGKRFKKDAATGDHIPGMENDPEREARIREAEAQVKEGTYPGVNSPGTVTSEPLKGKESEGHASGLVEAKTSVGQKAIRKN